MQELSPRTPIKRNGSPKMLTLQQTVGLLQRFMLQRNAAEWLENDRNYSPVLPFIRQGDAILYYEDDLLRFVKKLATQASVRCEEARRERLNRRHIPVDRRDFSDRRYLRRHAAAHNLDRRFAVRQDRRCDLDRRIRGWVDRRCVEDRRTVN
jgi:hypothetical protein